VAMSRLFILDEPFQGVDISARRDIATKLRASADGRATLLFVTEIDEALETADRILVMSEHAIVGEHRNDDIDLDRLLAEVAGGPLTSAA
ncbi:sugar ABC transporter ATP-binding protein, partial [Mesorhizobium sp. M1A.F.Ca.IN.022.07.1.1]